MYGRMVTGGFQRGRGVPQPGRTMADRDHLCRQIAGSRQSSTAGGLIRCAELSITSSHVLHLVGYGWHGAT
jgi:hypothetical protein